MRYLDVDTYQYTDTHGRVLTVKEMREIPAYSVSLTINRAADDDLDEIASRSYVFGEGGERDSYKLYEANLAALLDANFDLSLFPRMVIPQ